MLEQAELINTDNRIYKVYNPTPAQWHTVYSQNQSSIWVLMPQMAPFGYCGNLSSTGPDIGGGTSLVERVYQTVEAMWPEASIAEDSDQSEDGDSEDAAMRADLIASVRVYVFPSPIISSQIVKARLGRTEERSAQAAATSTASELDTEADKKPPPATGHRPAQS